MLKLALGFAERDVCLFDLLVDTLGRGARDAILGPYSWDNRVLRLIKLILSFVILVQQCEVRFPDSLRIYVLFSDLWFHYYWFRHRYYFWGLSNSWHFSIFVRDVRVHIL